MRKELFYKPGLLIERIAEVIADRRRQKRLSGTQAFHLKESQLSSLEFLELAAQHGKINTIYDLGANVGTWSLLAHSIFPLTKIHAFEPIPQYQEKYLQNCADPNQFTLHKVGVGNSNKREKFNFAGHSSSFFEVSNALVEMFPNEKKSAEITVEMVRLDDYVSNQNLPLPELMKLDVEGFELEVLKHAVNCLQHSQFVILEVSFLERHIGQPLFHEVVQFMAEHRFYVHAFPYKMPLCQSLSSVDILFKKQESK